MVARYVSHRSPTVLADNVASAWTREWMLVLSYSIAIAFAAQVAIPLPYGPVPLTLQTFAVLLGAAGLGPRRAITGALVYVGAGAVGVPQFASTGGATTGYLAGFVVAAGVVGMSARHGRDRRLLASPVSMAFGNLMIYISGVAGLVVLTGMTLRQALTVGVAPFVVGDALKIVVAGASLPAAWHLIGRSAPR